MSPTSREELGNLVRAHREQRGWTQAEVAERADHTDVNRSSVAHLEQGLRVPRAPVLRAVCELLEIPVGYWDTFTNPRARLRIQFEEHLGELVGRSVDLEHVDAPSREVANAHIASLFESSSRSRLASDSPDADAASETTALRTDVQMRGLFGSVLVFYGVGNVSRAFFERYLGASAFVSIDRFAAAVETYQRDAIRLFTTLGEAWRVLNDAGDDIDEILRPLEPRSLEPYRARRPWRLHTPIPDGRLPDLGYISAATVRRESAERRALSGFLEDLAERIRSDGRRAVEATPVRVRRKMDSLRRKFGSEISHGFFSPLFAPDPDELEREAARLAPKSDAEIAQMQATQEAGLRNLADYLSADHMDVYVATSMRHRADFISVNHFVRALFDHPDIAPLKLRYFNPTQSWIDDRIAKGLVEALMLRRAAVTIYMAQKQDTFGKDSEASVALGQGKPVIVYVPKLSLPASDGVAALDAEALFQSSRRELAARLPREDAEHLDESVDHEALVGRILARSLRKLPESALVDAVRRVWADFDLYVEAHRIEDPDLRASYRAWLDGFGEAHGTDQARTQRSDRTTDGIAPSRAIPHGLRRHIEGILVATATNFEKRARLFREIHPLALQVILSSGVLNGILVVRTVAQCAAILRALIRNELSLTLEKDERNYRLVETTTRSTIRVISRHRLLRHAFESLGGPASG